VRGVLPLLAAALVTATACSDGGGGRAPSARPTPAPENPGLVYVAMGASETVGAGSREPLRQAWPQVLFRTALARGANLVNLGIPGTTVAGARRRELPYALDLRPNLVTVWLNVNDLVAGVTPDEYERNLEQLVSELRRGGVEDVLIANTPPLIHLPAYRACRLDSTSAEGACFTDESLPGPRRLSRLVGEYNAVIERVAARQGAAVVDLYERFRAARHAGALRRMIGADGFHPSTAGHRAVAAAFAAALRSVQEDGG
jgi:lysophospholipase L1-like esterase